MITTFFKTIFYIPLYNGLVFLLPHIPYADVGLTVIVFTFIVKLILFPLSRAAVRAQVKMKELEPELNKIKVQYEKDKEEQARQTMLFYKNNNINPFSGLLLALIQIPIIFSLYFIFLHGGLPHIDTTLLYPFVHAPSIVNVTFLGFVNISKTNILLGALAALSQFIQIRLSIPAIKRVENPTFKDDLARSMNMQMRYILPIFVFIISFKVSGAVDLYWATSNLFMVLQELFVRAQLKSQGEIKTELQ